MSDMESLLREKYERDHLESLMNGDPEARISPEVVLRPNQLHAESECDLDKLMVLVGELVNKTMKKRRVEFIPDEGARLETDSMKKIDHPYILFEVIEMKPDLELKPRVRKQFVEESDDKTKTGRHGQVFGQVLNCLVQFNIFGCDYEEANQVMRDFEDLMFRYTAHFKEQGVAELIFSNRFTDRNYDTYRQKLSVRSLRYFVRIEKNRIFFNADVSGIRIK